MNLSKKQRLELRMKFGGRCAYCGCELPEKGWHADHVEPVRREWWKDRVKVTWGVGENGGLVKTEEKQTIGFERPQNDTLENLFPACQSCNLDKHAMSLETWRGVIAHKVQVCRNTSAFRHAERFGLVAITEKPIVFWFEQYQGATT